MSLADTVSLLRLQSAVTPFTSNKLLCFCFVFHFGHHSLSGSHFHKQLVEQSGLENAKRYADITRLLHMSAVEEGRHSQSSESLRWQQLVGRN